MDQVVFIRLEKRVPQRWTCGLVELRVVGGNAALDQVVFIRLEKRVPQRWTCGLYELRLGGNAALYNTGYFSKVYRNLQVWVPPNILKYLSIQKLPQSGLISLSIYRIQTKKYHIMFRCFTNINICKYVYT